MNFSMSLLNKTIERVNAFKEYIKDVEEKKFDDPKITVGIEDKEFDKFMNIADKI